MAVESGWDAAVGSVAQETARLLDALARANGAPPTEERRAAPDAHSESETQEGPERADHAHVPMGSAETCSWCPICRGVALVRDLSPDTLRSLADVAGLAATTLADLAATRARAGDTGTPPSGSPDRPGAARPSAVAAVEIPVTVEPDGTPDDLEVRP